MSVRKPLEKTKMQPIDIDALIEKGAAVKQDKSDEVKKWIIINLRMSKQMLNDVDDSVCNRVGITRTGWILEAIHEKLKKEKLG